MHGLTYMNTCDSGVCIIVLWITACFLYRLWYTCVCVDIHTVLLITIFWFIDIDECLSSNGGCSQMCRNSLFGFQCECLSGYVLAPDQRTCYGMFS